MTPRQPRDTITNCPCGFTSPRTTAGLAAKALRIHSCTRWETLAAAHTRGTARMAKIDRTPMPCWHKIAEHQHGTYAAYVLDACRCPPCATAASDYERKRIRAHAYGRYNRLTDAQPVRQHVTELLAAGMGLKQIAKVSGVPHGALWKLMYGKRGTGGARTPSVRVTRVNADKLLTVRAQLSTLAGGAFVDATGTRRRVQALVACGYSMSSLAVRLGRAPTNFITMLDRDQVSVRTARAVIDLYEQLWDTPPPAATHREKISVSRSRNFAAARGWLPPLAWDDEHIDDPGAAPAEFDADDQVDEIAVHRLIAGTLKPAARKTTPDLVEAIRTMALNLNDRGIAERLGISVDAVLKIRLRNDIPNAGRRTA